MKKFMNDRISKEQLSNIRGGRAGSCQFIAYGPYGETVHHWDLSMNDALGSANAYASQGYSSNWCCDSCDSASWAHH